MRGLRKLVTAVIVSLLAAGAEAQSPAGAVDATDVYYVARVASGEARAATAGRLRAGRQADQLRWRY